MNRQFVLGVIIMLTLAPTIGVSPVLLHQWSAYSLKNDGGSSVVKAPIATSGKNIYIAWWSNKTGNDEVMFRASTDEGKTFGNKINLSNSTDANSTRVEIAAEGNIVIVTWWETNETDTIPVAKISNDNGKTFGEVLKLATNGTISTGEVKPLI